MRYSWMIIAFLHGTWRVTHSPPRNDPLFYIQENLVTTHADSAILSMKPKWTHPNKIHLSDLTIVKKPIDWMNIAKYRKKIFYFHHIRRHGLDVSITFLNDTHIKVETFLPPDHKIEICLERLQGSDLT